jgi:hypothetical protein
VGASAREFWPAIDGFSTGPMPSFVGLRTIRGLDSVTFAGTADALNSPRKMFASNPAAVTTASAARVAPRNISRCWWGAGIIASLFLSVAVAACSHDGAPSTQPTPTPPPTPVDLGGTWSGPASDSSGPGRLTWELTQNGTVFTGTIAMSDTDTGVSGHGSISGTVSGSASHFSMSVAAGGFEDPFGSCTSSVSGDAELSSAAITGAYSGSNSCTGSIASGQIRLTRP